MQITEVFVETPLGRLFAKRWEPERLDSPIPAVLVHDSLGCVGLWKGFPEELASRLARPVIAYDRLGFGRSDPRAALPSPKFVAEEATGYFPALKAAFSLDQYILIGHSVGGGMSIHIAARDAGCQAVVTIASQAFVEEITTAGIHAAREMFQSPFQMSRLEKWHGDKADWVLRAWADVWLSDEFSGWSLEPVIGSVNCPVLAIHGDQDEYGSRAFPEFIAGKSGGPSEMLWLEGCGHVPHRERPEEVLAGIKLFLNRQSL